MVTMLWYAVSALAKGDTFENAIVGAFWGAVWFGLLIVPVLLTLSIPISFVTDVSRKPAVRFCSYGFIIFSSFAFLLMAIEAEKHSYDKPIYNTFAYVGFLWTALDLFIVPIFRDIFRKQIITGKT